MSSRTILSWWRIDHGISLKNPFTQGLKVIHHLYLKKNVKKRKNAFLPFLLHFLLVILFLIHFLTNLISVLFTRKWTFLCSYSIRRLYFLSFIYSTEYNVWTRISALATDVELC